MAAIALPNTLADINADWLTEALRSTETIQKARVASCRAETIAAGTGLMADLARLYISTGRRKQALGLAQNLVAFTQRDADELVSIRVTVMKTTS